VKHRSRSGIESLQEVLASAMLSQIPNDCHTLAGFAPQAERRDDVCRGIA